MKKYIIKKNPNPNIKTIDVPVREWYVVFEDNQCISFYISLAVINMNKYNDVWIEDQIKLVIDKNNVVSNTKYEWMDEEFHPI